MVSLHKEIMHQVFLLPRSPPRDVPVLEQVSERIVSRALFLLSLPSQATRVSLQEQSKRRWSILAKLSGVAAISRTPSQSNYLVDGESFVAAISLSTLLLARVEERAFSVRRFRARCLVVKRIRLCGK